MVGSSIDHYLILQLIDSGGMGVVYKAQDTRLGRFVAIKFLPPALTAAAEEKQRFTMEARAASSLDHPNICTVYEINETEFGQMYIALAYYEGETLKVRIEKGPLESQEALQIALQIARGLAKAHAHGIVHRDIKPANIIITPDNTAKILDFGLAKLAAGSRISHSHSTLGTVAYMPPEQARGDEVDQRADLWSLGVVLYEMVTGHLPFRGDSEAALLYRITNEQPIPAQRWRPDLDPRLAAVLGRCLEKEPAQRYQSADELLHDLQICSQTDAEPKKETRLLARRPRSRIIRQNLKRRWPWLAGIIAFSALVIAALLFVHPAGESAKPVPAGERVIVFFPFTVSGTSEFTALQEGMMDMLFSNLNGTEGWRCVDPRIVMSRASLRFDEKMDFKKAQRISRSFGASHFLMGSLVVTHGRVRCNGSLYTSAARDGNPVAVSSESDEGDLAALADRLAIQILTHYDHTPVYYLSRSGNVGTQSLPALKAYLEGVKFDRAGNMAGAYRLFTLATQYDSTFSMAWLRRCDIDQRYLLNPVQAAIDIEKAVSFSEKLHIQERRMIWAWEKLIQGQNDLAVELAQFALDEEPNNFLALFLLVNRWPLMANLYGHSVLENHELEKRLLALDPVLVYTYEGISYAALKRGQRAEIDALLKRFKELEHPYLQAWTKEMGRLYLLEERGNRQHFLQKALLRSPGDRMGGVENAILFARDLVEAREAVRLLVGKSVPLPVQAHGYMLMAAIEIGRGRRADASVYIDSLAALFPEYKKFFNGMYLPLHLYLSPGSSRHVDVNAITQWQPAGIPGSTGARFNPVLAAQPYIEKRDRGGEYDFLPIGALLPHFRWYHLSLLSYYQGDTVQARLFRQRLAAESVPPDAASLLRVWDNTLQALEVMLKGDDVTALQFLEQESPAIRWPLLLSPIYSIAFPRFLRAELLHRLGRDEEALRWYTSLTELFIHDIPYRAPALFRMAEICAKLGRPAEAAGYYQQFLFLWRDCDPLYKPMTAAAAQRLQELQARRPEEER